VEEEEHFRLKGRVLITQVRVFYTGCGIFYRVLCEYETFVQCSGSLGSVSFWVWDPDSNPNPSINIQKKIKKNLDLNCFVSSL
jgi:hypothetical protein